MRTTTTSVDQRQRRTGVNTRLVERVDQVSMGDRVVSIDVVPWMRTRDVNFTVTGMKPNTRVYAFFDKVDVNADTKPTSASASNTTLTNAVTKTSHNYYSSLYNRLSQQQEQWVLVILR